MGDSKPPSAQVVARRAAKPAKDHRKGSGGKRRGPAPGRLAAARALVRVDSGDHIEDALARLAPPDGRDRGQAWFLALGVLRHRAQVDAALRAHLSTPIGGLDSEVRAALRVGAFEKLFARTGDHAAVNEGVEVVKSLGAGRARGLVNAVLRRVKPVDDLGDADRLNHPAWLVARWRDRYGPEAVDAWCTANNRPAPLAIVCRDEPSALTEALVAAGLNPESVTIGDQVLAGVLRLTEAEGKITELPGFDAGQFWVQDPAAVAVADLVTVGQGTRVLDACAAPGGKTFRLLSRGAQVTAVDHQGARLQRLREGLTRLDLSATIRHHDWTSGAMPDAGPAFDAVIVDAPCTGLGTIRRHPEIRWRRQITDLLAMPTTQLAILSSASTHVRAGGQLVYAVCSPEPEEGPQVIERFLAEHQDFSLQTELSTAPPQGDEDAHYAARLVRA